MSRVPVWWSMIPTTMKSVALNAAWATSSIQPAVVAAGVPGAEQDHHEAELADGAEREEQLEVVLAQGAQAAEHHRGAADGEHERPPAAGGRRTPGRSGPIRYTPAVTIVAECR